MKWLRLYHEARQDAKLECLTDAQFRVWFRLLCFASEQPERGTVACLDTRLLAMEVAGGNSELLLSTLDILESFACVEKSSLPNSWGVENLTVRFLKFRERQYLEDPSKPQTSTERVRRHRLAKRTTAAGTLPEGLTYEGYLLTPWWKERRLKALAFARHRCQVCNASEPLDIHHRTYKRLGRETDRDLVALCRACHDIFHTSGKLINSRQEGGS